MPNLFTQEEVRKLARQAGFSSRNAKIASAIAMCESAYGTKGGVPVCDFDQIGDQALANSTWGYSYGGFQIRSLRAHKGTGKIRDELRLLDPEFNVASARKIKQTQGWTAWSVYLSGAYKAYLQDMYPPPPNTYIVISGDTLSSIGQKHNIPWEDLARWNNIHEPYSIYLGQKIYLEPRV